MDPVADDSETLTFVCLAANQVASFVDVASLRPGRHRAHAQQLFRGHASAETIEIWRDDQVWEIVRRDGIRAIGATSLPGEEGAGASTANRPSPDDLTSA